MEPSRFEVFKQASRIATKPPSLGEIFIALLLIILLILIFVVLPYHLYKRYKEIVKKRSFFQIAANYNLEPEEIEFLWKVSREFRIDPNLLLTSYATFQRMVYRYVKKYGTRVNLQLINSIRSKLGFTKLPEFVPLSTTLDIELYQPVSIIVGDEQFEGAVVENNEAYWAVSFIKGEPSRLHPGDEVIVSFVRPNDGRYIVTTKVIDITRQQGQLVARLEHTDKLEKIQLRAYIRWPVNIPCKFAYFPLKYIDTGMSLDEIVSKLKFHDGFIKDISVGGLKLCTEHFDDIKKVQEGGYILVNFILGDTPFENIICEVVRTVRSPFSTEVCFGCAFVDLPNEYQQKIQQFIWEEQRKIIKLYKEGEV